MANLDEEQREAAKDALAEEWNDVEERGESQVAERGDWPELVSRIDPETVSVPS